MAELWSEAWSGPALTLDVGVPLLVGILVTAVLRVRDRDGGLASTAHWLAPTAVALFAAGIHGSVRAVAALSTEDTVDALGALLVHHGRGLVGVGLVASLSAVLPGLVWHRAFGRVPRSHRTAGRAAALVALVGLGVGSAWAAGGRPPGGQLALLGLGHIGILTMVARTVRARTEGRRDLRDRGRHADGAALILALVGVLLVHIGSWSALEGVSWQALVRPGALDQLPPLAGLQAPARALLEGALILVGVVAVVARLHPRGERQPRPRSAARTLSLLAWVALGAAGPLGVVRMVRGAPGLPKAVAQVRPSGDLPMVGVADASGLTRGLGVAPGPMVRVMKPSGEQGSYLNGDEDFTMLHAGSEDAALQVRVAAPGWVRVQTLDRLVRHWVPDVARDQIRVELLVRAPGAEVMGAPALFVLPVRLLSSLYWARAGDRLTPGLLAPPEVVQQVPDPPRIDGLVFASVSMGLQALVDACTEAGAGPGRECLVFQDGALPAAPVVPDPEAGAPDGAAPGP